MESVGGAEVGLAVAAMVEVLTPHATDRDWSVRAGSLDWSCWTTAAHVAHDLLAYAGQVTSRQTILDSPTPALGETKRTEAGLLRYHWDQAGGGGTASDL